MEYMGYSVMSDLDGFIDRQLGQMCMNLDNLDNLDLVKIFRLVPSPGPS